MLAWNHIAPDGSTRDLYVYSELVVAAACSDTSRPGPLTTRGGYNLMTNQLRYSQRLNIGWQWVSCLINTRLARE